MVCFSFLSSRKVDYVRAFTGAVSELFCKMFKFDVVSLFSMANTLNHNSGLANLWSVQCHRRKVAMEVGNQSTE